MPVRADEQSKRTMCIALYNRDLHKNNICPGNHSVSYDRGWFYFDQGKTKFNRDTQRIENVGHIHRDQDITSEADKKLAEGWEVLYSEVWNTYVLGDPPLSEDYYNGEDNEEE